MNKNMPIDHGQYIGKLSWRVLEGLAAPEVG